MKKRLLLFIIVLTLINSHFIFSQVKPVIHQSGFNDFWATSINYCPELNSIFVAGYDGAVRQIDSKSGILMNIIQKDVNSYEEWDFLHQIYYIDISPDSKLLCASNLEIWNLNSNNVSTQLEGFGNTFIKNIEFSPTGKFVAGIGDLYSSDSTIFVWQVDNGKLLYKIERSNKINNLKFGKDDNTIYFFEDDINDITCKKFDLKGNKIVGKIKFYSSSNSGMINISKNEKYIVDYSITNSSIFSIEKNANLFNLKRNWDSEVIFSEDEKYVIYFDKINGLPFIVFLRIENQTIEKVIPIHFLAYNLLFSSSQNVLIAKDQSFIEMINLENDVRFPVISHNFQINSVHFTDNNKSFLTTEKGPNVLDYYRIQQFDIATNRRQWVIPSPRQKNLNSNDYSFPTTVSSDGKLFTVDGYDYDKQTNAIFIYNTREGSLNTKLYGNTSNFSQLIFSVDSKYIYTSSLDSCIKKWELSTGKVTDSIRFDKDIQYFTVNEESGEYYLILGEYDRINSVNAYKFNTHDLIKVFELKFNFTIFDKPYAFSPDNRYFATNLSYGSKVNRIVVLDMLLKDTLALIETPEVQRLIFTNDNKGLITFSKETRELVILDLNNILKFQYISEYLHKKVNWNGDNLKPPLITSLAFSPDGRYFAFGNDEPAVLIYDTQTLDINEENYNNKIDNCDVFPNPVRDRAEIKLNEVYPSQPVISIYNVFGGRQAVQAEFVSAGDTQKFIINNINLAPGFYIYTITGESNKQRGSFVVKE
jgi:WD40 repeat protein